MPDLLQNASEEHYLATPELPLVVSLLYSGVYGPVNIIRIPSRGKSHRRSSICFLSVRYVMCVIQHIQRSFLKSNVLVCYKRIYSLFGIFQRVQITFLTERYHGISLKVSIVY